MKKELLIKLRDRVKPQAELPSGLCLEVNLMASNGDITEDEQDELRAFIKKHRPTKGKHFDPTRKYESYFWPMCQTQPRLKWLNYCIKYTGSLNLNSNTWDDTIDC